MKQSIHILARALIIDQEHILLCKSKTLKHQFYFLPGGHVESGENPKEALARELQEETGESFIIEELLWDFDYSFEPKNNQKICHTHERNIIFKAKTVHVTVDKPLKQIEDHIELVWAPLATLEMIDLKPQELKTLIKAYYLSITLHFKELLSKS